MYSEFTSNTDIVGIHIIFSCNYLPVIFCITFQTCSIFMSQIKDQDILWLPIDFFALI